MYITGTRADYGLMRNTLKLLNSETELTVVACGMHIMEEFGLSINHIKEDGFRLLTVDQVFKEDNKASMSEFIGNTICDLTKIMVKEKPDLVLLLGDRGEMLAGATVASYLNIPIAHIHGGDISSTVDDSARHAITKLANIHLPATLKSAQRIIQMGENPENVFVVGAPGLDDIIAKKDKFDLNMLKNKYSITKPLIMVLQHPVNSEDASYQMNETLKALDTSENDVIAVYPNADAGGRSMINEIKKYPQIKAYKTIARDDFIGLLNIATVLIGNSSSGIIESGSFKLPVINIGTRQEGRERAGNVIDVDYRSEEIKKALDFIKTEEFKEILENVKNPYGNGNASVKITEILKNIDLNEDLINKRFYEIER